jgi:TonB family protein
MFKVSWALVLGLVASVPAFAQTPDAATARNAKNWDTLMKLYPPRALAAREQGLVGFMVKLDKDGQPRECQVTHSSGHPLLDQETCKLITLHVVFKPNGAASGSQLSTHQGVINWRLPNSASLVNATPPKPVTVANAPDKIICKRVPRTGSNVGTERVCMARRDWQTSSEESRREFEELQGKKGSTSGN